MSAIEVLRHRYRSAAKKRKGGILDELERAHGVDRKHLVRLLARREAGRPRKSARGGRPSQYGDARFQGALRQIWKATKYMCGKYLHAAMFEWVPAYEQVHGAFEPDVRERLYRISAATIDRWLRPHKAEHGLTTTRSGGIIRSEIPTQGNEWNIGIPGYLECDTVAHCGGSTMGEYVSTLTTVDIALTWTEVRAVWGKGYSNVLEQLRDIEKALPFTILGYDSDNGSEVLNWHVIKYFRERKVPVAVTRSRAYCKNDNAHVEQKNSSIARRYLGYERLDFEQLVPLINHYYRDIVCPLANHFFPSHKLKDKRQHAGRRFRVYDPPMTPYARALASPYVTEQAKAALRARHQHLNPVQLSEDERRIRKQIDSQLRQLKAAHENRVSKNNNFQINNHESSPGCHNFGDMEF